MIWRVCSKPLIPFSHDNISHLIVSGTSKHPVCNRYFQSMVMFNNYIIGARPQSSVK
nr:hypothetical protein [Escherichia coli]